VHIETWQHSSLTFLPLFPLVHLKVSNNIDYSYLPTTNVIWLFLMIQ
jgi:hypothetical protein